MTDTAKEDIRTRWAPHELEKVAFRMVQLQAATPGLGDLEAVRQAQMVLDRQRVINQWQNAKRLDPILARMRAELAAGTLDLNAGAEPTTNTTASTVPAAAPAPTAPIAPVERLVPVATAPMVLPLEPSAPIAPIAAISDAVMPVDEPRHQAQPENEARIDGVHSSDDEPLGADAAQEDPSAAMVLPVVVVTTPINALTTEDKAAGDVPAGKGVSFDDEDDIAIDFYADGTDVSGKAASEIPPVNASPPVSVIRFVDDEPEGETPESIPESIPPSLASPAVREPVNVSEPEFVVEPVDVKAVVGNSLPTAGDIQLALVNALTALVPADALDNVLRSLAIEGPLESLSEALEKAISDERAGVLDQEPEADATDTKIFVAGFAGSEQKSIESALSRYDVRVWTPSKGPQAFESMAKACTIAVISEAMGDDVDEMLRSLKIKIVTHQGSTSRLAERIAEMA